jgi:exopolysaccharide biosynthesis polyprenyl glycosylphosphotransferase
MTAGGDVLAKPAREGLTGRAPLPAERHTAPVAGSGVTARDRRGRAILLAADVVAAAAATLAAGVPAWLLAIPAVVLLVQLHGLYERDELVLRKSTLDEAPQLLQAATLATLGLWLLDPAHARRGAVVVFAVTLLAGTLLARLAARRAAAALIAPERCLFIGDAPEYERLRGKLASRSVHAQLVGRIALRGEDDAAAQAGDRVAIEELIAQTGAHRVVIDPHALPSGDMLDVVRAAKALGLRVTLLPRVLDVVGSAVVFDDLEGLTVLGVRRFGLSRSSRIVKRAFDLVVATLALIAAAPLMALFALAIVCESRGPVLFRQLRVGRDGRPFLIIKFRTMAADADERRQELRRQHGLDGDLFKLRDDPRVTRVGRLLRATSLDELPQLLNVVRGDMSLVGPRPLVVDEDAQITGWDRRRLHLTPGITGLWQIAGTGRVPLAEMVKIDYLYVAGWSLWLDVRILLRTIPYVLGGRGM